MTGQRLLSRWRNGSSPRATASARARRTDPPTAPSSRVERWLDPRELEPQRILIAEDDLEMRRLLAATVRKDGYEVTEARTGAELQDLLADLLRRPASRPPFDLIISDHRMPGLTGLEVLKGMQDESWLTPFIMITAFGSRQFEENARRAGAAAVFNKPFDIDDLRSAILNLIGRPQP